MLIAVRTAASRNQFLPPKSQKKGKGQKRARPKRVGKKTQRAGMVSAPISRGYFGPTSSRAIITGNPYSPGGRLRIQHRELIADVGLVYTTGAPDDFHIIESGQVNPGFDATSGTDCLPMPWLKGLAKNFQFYRFKNLSFDLMTEVPTTTGGSVYLAQQEDVELPLPSTKAKMMLMKGAWRGPPYKEDISMQVPQELLAQYGKRFVLKGLLASPDNQDNTYTTGRLVVACSGITSAAGPPNAGSVEVYAKYDIELWDPIDPDDTPGLSSGPPPTAIQSATVSNNSATPFGQYFTGGTGSKQPAIGPDAIQFGANSVGLPVGRWLIERYFEAAPISLDNPIVPLWIAGVGQTVNDHSSFGVFSNTTDTLDITNTIAGTLVTINDQNVTSYDVSDMWITRIDPLVAPLPPWLPKIPAYSSYTAGSGESVSKTSIFGDGSGALHGYENAFFNNTVQFIDKGSYLVALHLYGTSLTIPSTAGTVTTTLLDGILNGSATEAILLYRADVVGTVMTFDASASGTVDTVFIRVVGNYPLS